MKNNRLMKAIAWIMAAMMICGFAASAMADGNTTIVNSGTTNPITIGGSTVLNEICTVSETYQTEAGKKIDMTTAAVGTECILLLSASNGYNNFPQKFTYRLPARVQEAKDGSNTVLSWTYNAEKKELTFTWNNGAQDTFSAMIEVKLTGYDLYNSACVVINGKETWYRLGKTAIQVDVPSKEYKAGVTEYSVEPYDFTGSVLTINGIPYVYTDDPDNVTVPSFTAVQKGDITDNIRIGGMDGSNPRWLLGGTHTAYTDGNYTRGYHRDYTITLIEAPIEQPLFNFLNIDKTYYRLKKTTVVAKPIRNYKAGYYLTEDEFTLPTGDYDFTNLILEDKNGELYRYSPTELTGDYESYYTITVETKMLVKNKMHNNVAWFSDEKGWLDDSKATFTEDELKSNDQWGFHRDYKVAFHKGKPLTLEANEDSNENLEIRAYSDWPEDKVAFAGAEIPMRAELIGFEGKSYDLQWQHSTDGENWVDEPNSNSITFTYILNEETSQYVWRVVAKNIKDLE
jgi:hypothetical protein